MQWPRYSQGLEVGQRRNQASTLRLCVLKMVFLAFPCGPAFLVTRQSCRKIVQKNLQPLDSKPQFFQKARAS
jgi:hypothetical protein